MAKRSRNTKGRTPTQRQRKEKPRILKQKKSIITGCPFCEESHPIYADQVAHCGTYVEMMAIQPIFRGKRLVCALCGEAGGTLVKIGDQYKHDFECSPGKFVYSEPPKLSKTAKLLYRSPQFVQKVIYSVTKRYVQQVGTMEKGEVKEISGYTWKKAQKT